MSFAKPGDVVLYHRPTFSFFTWMIHVATRSRWNHAALVVEVDPMHGPIVAEATAEGVKYTPLSETTDRTWVHHPTYDDEEDRLTAISWASARVGVRYGYLNAFFCGLNNILVGFGRGRFVIKKTDAIICSELVAEALTRAGHDFGKDNSQVSPGDLADYFGIPR